MNFQTYDIYKIFCVVFLLSCDNNKNGPQLPIFGERKVNKVSQNGKESVDTIYHTIGQLSFLNQHNNIVNDNSLKGKVFIANLFHSTFQTKTDTLMEATLDSVNHILASVNDFYIISYTVNPNFDTPEALNRYCSHKNIGGKNWYFLTGQRVDSLYKFIRYNYLLNTEQDSTSIGTVSFIHSDQIVLVDKKLRIRGYYKGTEINNVNKIVADAKMLLYKDTL